MRTSTANQKVERKRYAATNSLFPAGRMALPVLRKRILTDDAIQGRMLHIAPESALSAKFEAMDDLVYITSDLSEDRVSTRFDICDIPMADDTFDFLMCSHVLEHVSDDRHDPAEQYDCLAAGAISKQM